MGLQMNIYTSFNWTCFHNGVTFPVIRLAYDDTRSITLHLFNGGTEVLAPGSMHWIEFLLYLNSNHFTLPLSHGLIGVLALRKLRRLLAEDYQPL